MLLPGGCGRLAGGRRGAGARRGEECGAAATGALADPTEISGAGRASRSCP